MSLAELATSIAYSHHLLECLLDDTIQQGVVCLSLGFKSGNHGFTVSLRTSEKVTAVDFLQFGECSILFLLCDGCRSIDVLHHGVLLSSGGLETSNLTTSQSSDLVTHEPLVDELVLLIGGGEANG
jgi:hypothetical protein